MEFNRLKSKFRRRYRRSQKQLGTLSVATEESLEKNVLLRFGRLRHVRRFVIGWVGLMLLLIGGVLFQIFYLNGYFQTYQPVPGGIYREGILGRFTNANPLFASNDVDTSVSKLVFAGLFNYDHHNKLVGDLATSYKVDAKGSVYTVQLKPGLTWHDGKPLTAKDVVFTYKTIQNPDVQSPLLSSWQGIDVSSPSDTTVVFKLPSVLASFPYNLTTGIVPSHLLQSTPAADLRSSEFNTVRPVGAGPFRWQTLQVSGTDPATQREQIAFTPFKKYVHGQPKLSEFIVKAYGKQDALLTDVQKNQLNGAAGFSTLPSQLTKNERVQQHSLVLSAATMAFFKTTSGQLSDKLVRLALASSTDREAIIAGLGYPTHAVRSPFLQGQIGYDASLTQPKLDTKMADTLLDQAGYKIGQNGMRSKDGKALKFVLTASDTTEYRKVGAALQKQWKVVGADVKLQFLDETNFQSTFSTHQYDALLYGISIGADPDVFVYWDSSQADIRSANRLNLSEYKNTTADAALESGRTRVDPALRAIKYKPFLQAWQQDAPAVGLYQPRVLYLTNGTVSGLEDHVINSASDRYENVHNWQIRQAYVSNK